MGARRKGFRVTVTLTGYIDNVPPPVLVPKPDPGNVSEGAGISTSTKLPWAAQAPHAAEFLLPPARETVFWARWLTTAFLRRAGPAPADPGDVALVVTELVANVTRHTKSCCRLRLTAHPHHLIVEVHDDSPDWPRIVPQSCEREQGRGLAIVNALSERLDIVGAVDGGKTVRATLTPLPTPGVWPGR
ncbi:ATP-binding protein [Streptomyces chrestomyceticus]|uniref:ATP-binding protein n=1 Tax=Streptomyces chrestomyceticus TaxID=68185 RepID=UPI00368DB0CD